MKLRHLLLLYLSLLTSSSASYGQSGYRSTLRDYYMAKSIDGNLFFKRMSLAAGLHFITGSADLRFRGIADSTYKDVSVKQNMRAKQSYVFYAGSYVPITIISDNSMLVLNIELMAAISSLTYDSIALSQKTKIMAPTKVMKAGLPISLEYRLGSDVLLSRETKTMFTLGGGFNLCGVNSDDYAKINPIKLQPFIKAELGFVLGLAFKLRGVYTIGSSVYAYTNNFNVSGGPGDQLDGVFKGSNGYNLSLVIMPFSPGWN